MTSTWRIEPSGPLRGDVMVRGSKNAVTKHMVAALLADGPCVVQNCPEIGEVELTRGMLESLGCEVEVDGDMVTVDGRGLRGGQVPGIYGGRNRIPILLLGPLLHRLGEAFVPTVGGDRIGARPVDFHIGALVAMGAEVEVTEEGVHAKATSLHGARIRLPYPSVGATETVLLTAALAEGRTILENAATETEVIELGLYLQRMGARIELRPDRRWVIEGVDHLTGGVEHSLQGDRNEAFSYLVAGLVTGGRVRVFGCPQDRLVTAISTLDRMGARFEITDYYLAAEAEQLRSAVVQTDTHPGFMTDWQSPLVVLFTQCAGMSVLHETVYEDRFPYIDALQHMGAEIELFDSCLGGRGCRFHETGDLHSAVVHGPTKLRGAEITSPDIRGGFAYVIAAAAAEGASVLHEVTEIERGYHRPFEAFSELGLDITRR
ncbi:MAG: UDP-N-acetylglucosamine 1-carboxyvinyltransferase [Acidimicrobiia bacterium]